MENKKSSHMNINEILEEQIISKLKYDNPWWTTGEIPQDMSEMNHRPYTDVFYPYITDKSIRRALILMGPRRVGKTVMLYHSISRLLKDGVNPQKIIYMSIDSPIYNNKSLEQLFSLARQALKQPDEYGGFYLFYDEIQYLKNWEVHLKSLVDSYRDVKFIASGSAAAALKIKSNESGAGRFTDFMLPPLTFYEYLHLQDLDKHIIKETNSGIIPFDTVDINKLNEHFVDYINYGGYPEVVFSEKIRSNPGQYIKHDIIDKVLLRDLPSLYGISDTQELNRLFVYVAYRSGTEFSYEQLCKELGIRKELIKKYLEYFSAAFLIRIVSKTNQNAKMMKRVTNFKIYLTNPSLRCALFTPIKDTDNIGDMVETAIFSQWIQGGVENIYYANWKQGRERGEVDIVWVNQETQKPFSAVEIKWSDRYANNTKELKSLRYFIEENDSLQKVFVTTKTITKRESTLKCNMIFIPASIYAYWVSSYLFKQKADNKEVMLK